MGQALDRLKKSVSMASTRRSVELPDGTEFEYFSAPITLAQRAKAQKMSGGGDDAVAFGLQLLVMMAEDENGQRMFSPGEVAELRNELPASVVEALMLQLLQDAEGEEDLDPKPSSRNSKKTAT